MKNYIIGTLAVMVLLLTSIVFKQQNTGKFTHFPMKMDKKEKTAEASLYLFLFFSKKNCRPCLDEVVKVLNGLVPPFYVLGVVPGDELEDEKELRKKTGAAFPLSTFDRYKKYLPLYTPTLIGVSPSGEVLFVLPGISGSHGIYLEIFLESVYKNLSHILENRKQIIKGGKANEKYISDISHFDFLIRPFNIGPNCDPRV